MFIDFVTTTALARELNDSLEGSRVQEVVQPDRLSVAFELYAGARRYLTLTAHGAHEGLLLSDTKARRGGGAPSPLTLALRARAMGARLRKVEQPPHERILTFVFQAEAPVQLVAEMTGKMANVILVDEDGTVVAAARHVTPKMTRARVVLPGQPYAPPPPQRKADWQEVSEADLAGWCTSMPESTTWRMLLRSIRGMSPLAAREIAYRAGADPNDLAGEQRPAALHSALADVFGTVLRGEAVPSIARSAGHPVAYAPYRLTHLEAPARSAEAAEDVGLVENVETITLAIALFEEDRLGRDPYRDARAAVSADLAEVRERAQRRLASMEGERVDEAEMERLRLTGDMILTYQRQIEPGQTELTGAMDLEAPPITARLDPALTPVENAQAYYDRYRRKRKASRALPRRVAHVRAELATLEQLGADIELAESRPEIDAVGDALLDRSAGANSGSRRAHGSQVGGPLRLRSSDGFVLLVGRNSRQNETVTFGRASRADLWLHARGLPGGHVVIKAAGRRVPERTLLEAAGLALRFSGARGEGRAEVIVTEVRHVRHLRGGGPGMVTYDHEKTMVASPLDPAELDRARTTDML